MTDLRTDLEVIEDIAHEIITEREDQNAEWGEQNHPSTFSENDRRQAQRKADYWKQVNAARVALGCLAWDGILLEEVYEALAESYLPAESGTAASMASRSDPRKRRAELIQVAAVAAAEVECIDRLLAAEDVPDADAEVAAWAKEFGE